MQRRILIAAGLVVTLVVGVAIGTTVRNQIANAQTPTPGQTQTSGPGQLWNLFLNNLASALNIQRSTLNSAIASAGNSTIGTEVQQGKLTQTQANALKSRLQAGDLGAVIGRGGFRGGPGGFWGGPQGGVRQAMLDAAAKSLGLSTNQLLTDLRSGQTLAQLVPSGTTVQNVIDAALAAAKTQLDQAVKNGTLTQTQENAIYTRLQQQGANLFSFHGYGPGRHGWNGSKTAPQAPTATPQA